MFFHSLNLSNDALISFQYCARDALVFKLSLCITDLVPGLESVGALRRRASA